MSVSFKKIITYSSGITIFRVGDVFDDVKFMMSSTCIKDQDLKEKDKSKAELWTRIMHRLCIKSFEKADRSRHAKHIAPLFRLVSVFKRSSTETNRA